MLKGSFWIFYIVFTFQSHNIYISLSGPETFKNNEIRLVLILSVCRKIADSPQGSHGMPHMSVELVGRDIGVCIFVGDEIREGHKISHKILHSA